MFLISFLAICLEKDHIACHLAAGVGQLLLFSVRSKRLPMDETKILPLSTSNLFAWMVVAFWFVWSGSQPCWPPLKPEVGALRLPLLGGRGSAEPSLFSQSGLFHAAACLAGVSFCFEHHLNTLRVLCNLI